MQTAPTTRICLCISYKLINLKHKSHVFKLRHPELKLQRMYLNLFGYPRFRPDFIVLFSAFSKSSAI